MPEVKSWGAVAWVGRAEGNESGRVPKNRNVMLWRSKREDTVMDARSKSIVPHPALPTGLATGL